MIVKLIPDLDKRLDKVRPDLLCQIVEDVENVSSRLVSMIWKLSASRLGTADLWFS